MVGEVVGPEPRAGAVVHPDAHRLAVGGVDRERDRRVEQGWAVAEPDGAVVRRRSRGAGSRGRRRSATGTAYDGTTRIGSMTSNGRSVRATSSDPSRTVSRLGTGWMRSSGSRRIISSDITTGTGPLSSDLRRLPMASLPSAHERPLRRENA